MKKNFNEALFSCVDNTFEVIFSIETILYLTQKYCLINDKNMCLNEERDQYICMLNIALEKLNTLKQLNLELEDKLTDL